MSTTNQHAQEQPPASFQVGYTAICVADRQFQQGYQHGYENFTRWWAKRTFTDHTLYTFLITNLLNAHAPNRENAGYVVGWLAALLEHQQEQAEPLPTAEQKGDTDHASHLLHGTCWARRLSGEVLPAPGRAGSLLRAGTDLSPQSLPLCRSC